VAVEVCSTAFVSLGHAQAKALGYAELPIVAVPHPFGGLSRDKTREAAEKCVAGIVLAALEKMPDSTKVLASTDFSAEAIEVSADPDEINRLIRDRLWSDGLPVVPATAERVQRMLSCTPRKRNEVVAMLAPAFGAATVELIAINAVMAGCDPEYLPVLIAATEAIADSSFNLQGIQTTTNPAAAWLIVNGPVARRLGMNSGINCLGQGNWANATLGRALRLIMQNIGGALSGDMDRATIGQPGKYLFCCAENEQENPWEPLHVEKGYRPEQSTVTVVGAEGTLNLNTHSKNADEILRIFAQTLARPSGNDYFLCGQPWIILCPEHAAVMKKAGLSKLDVKRRFWAGSQLPVRYMTDIDRNLTQVRRRSELGEFTSDTTLPICSAPESLGIVVCGSAGTHSVYVPSFGNTRSVTREIVWSA
jgi:hypothetical protein